MESSKSLETFIDDLSFNVLIPVLNKVFTLDTTPPTISRFNVKKFNNVMDTLSGRLFFSIDLNIRDSRSKVCLTIIYNIDHDMSRPNTFTHTVIEGIYNTVGRAHLFVLNCIVELSAQIPTLFITIPNINHISGPINNIDMLMTVYTKESVYKNMGFIQIAYPQLLADLQMILYTPMNELKIPADILKIVTNIFGIENTETLNTLFFVLYPKYVNNTYTAKEKAVLNKLYKFLIKTYDNIKLYTITTVYVKLNIPVPQISIMSNVSSFNGEVLKLVHRSTDRIYKKVKHVRI